MNNTFMKEKPVGPLLASMALPMVFSMLVNSLYNIVDSFFVAQISEQAMTALSLVYPVQNMINAVAIGFGIGINPSITTTVPNGRKLQATPPTWTVSPVAVIVPQSYGVYALHSAISHSACAGKILNRLSKNANKSFLLISSTPLLE